MLVVTVGRWGVEQSKKGAGGWDEISRVGGGTATGIYLTKHSCHACVCVCLERGRKRERIMVTQAAWLIQMGENTTRLCLVQHTLATPLSSPLSLLPFPPGPPSREGSQNSRVRPR